MEMIFDSFSEVANAFIQVIASPGFTGASVVRIVRSINGAGLYIIVRCRRSSAIIHFGKMLKYYSKQTCIK